jgi:hypothetical protein
MNFVRSLVIVITICIYLAGMAGAQPWEPLRRTASWSIPGQHALVVGTVQVLQQPQGLLLLQMDTGKTVAMRVSQALLSNLQAGDRVEVTMRVLSQEGLPNMRSTLQQQQGQ